MRPSPSHPSSSEPSSRQGLAPTSASNLTWPSEDPWKNTRLDFLPKVRPVEGKLIASIEVAISRAKDAPASSISKEEVWSQIAPFVQALDELQAHVSTLQHSLQPEDLTIAFRSFMKGTYSKRQKTHASKQPEVLIHDSRLAFEKSIRSGNQSGIERTGQRVTRTYGIEKPFFGMSVRQVRESERDSESGSGRGEQSPKRKGKGRANEIGSGEASGSGNGREIALRPCFDRTGLLGDKAEDLKFFEELRGPLEACETKPKDLEIDPKVVKAMNEIEKRDPNSRNSITDRFTLVLDAVASPRPRSDDIEPVEDTQTAFMNGWNVLRDKWNLSDKMHFNFYRDPQVLSDFADFSQLLLGRTVKEAGTTSQSGTETRARKRRRGEDLHTPSGAQFSRP